MFKEFSSSSTRVRDQLLGSLALLTTLGVIAGYGLPLSAQPLPTIPTAVFLGGGTPTGPPTVTTDKPRRDQLLAWLPATVPPPN